MKHLALLLFFGTLFSSCIKEEITLDNTLQIEGLDPSFAIPLGSISLNLGNIEQSQDINNFIYSEDDGIYALAFEKDLFNYSYGEILEIPSQNFSESFNADGVTASALNLLATGSSMDFPFTETITFGYSNGEEIDVVNISTGFLNLNLESSFKQDLTLEINFPTILDNGSQLAITRNLTYSGSTPIVISENIPLDGYAIHFNDDGVTIPLEINITITKTNEVVSIGDALDYNFNLQVDQIESVFGYFGQYTNVAASGSQTLNLFPTLSEGTLSFGDPRINLIITNSTGIDVDLDFTSVELQNPQGNSLLSGNDLTNFPTIARAINPGEENTTYHTINNTGISPNLNQVLDLSSTGINYEASVTTNPLGIDNNFLLDSSKISCHAQVVLPLFLGASNFTFVDTMDVDLASLLNVDSTETNTIDVEDIEKMTLRILIDNGFPLDIGVKVYFANEINQILDSLWIQNDYQYVFTSANVNFSVPQSDPEYGKVTSATSNFTDFSLSSEKLNDLVDAGSKKLIIKTIGNTTEASNGEMVKFYPEYDLKVKVSAKIDLNIELN